MNRNKLVATTMLIAIALSTFGYVYAAWTDLVYIYGTVDMGSLTMVFDWYEAPYCVEYYEDPDTGALVPGEWEGKDVANCSVLVSERFDDEHTGKWGYKNATILVENAYPQYIVHTVFLIHNIGTVPIKLCKLNLENGGKYDKDGNLIHELLYDGKNPGCLFEDRNDNGELDAEDVCVINISLTNKIPLQIDPNEKNKMEIDMDFKQDAQECHTYKFEVRVWGIQWNKPCTELPP